MKTKQRIRAEIEYLENEKRKILNKLITLQRQLQKLTAEPMAGDRGGN